MREDQTVFGLTKMFLSGKINLSHISLQWGLQIQQIFWCLNFLCNIITKNIRNTLSVYMKGKNLIWRPLTEWDEALLLWEPFTLPWWMFLTVSFHQVLLGHFGRNAVVCQPQRWSILVLSNELLSHYSRCLARHLRVSVCFLSAVLHALPRGPYH